MRRAAVPALTTPHAAAGPGRQGPMPRTSSAGSSRQDPVRAALQMVKARRTQRALARACLPSRALTRGAPAHPPPPLLSACAHLRRPAPLPPTRARAQPWARKPRGSARAFSDAHTRARGGRTAPTTSTSSVPTWMAVRAREDARTPARGRVRCLLDRPTDRKRVIRLHAPRFASAYGAGRQGLLKSGALPRRRTSVWQGPARSPAAAAPSPSLRFSAQLHSHAAGSGCAPR